MAPCIRNILKPPASKKQRTPSAEAICGYMKALDEECNRILKEEGITINNDNLTQVISEIESKGAR